MKKIINGVRYDTEVATLIGEYDNIGHGVDSTTAFAYWEAGLYIPPRSKRYFLAGEGGPMSRFARPAGRNSRTGGSGIIPMSEEDAFGWAQECLSTDEVEAHFGHLISDDDAPQIICLGYGTEQEIAEKIHQDHPNVPWTSSVIRDDDAAAVGASDAYLLCVGVGADEAAAAHKGAGGTISAVWSLCEFMDEAK